VWKKPGLKEVKILNHKPMKWVIITLTVLAALVALIYLIGYWLPMKHAASIQYTFSKNSPEDVWNSIISFKEYSRWRSGLKHLQVIDDNNWKETNSHGDTIMYHGEIVAQGKRFVSRIVSKELPYGGSWTYNVEAVEGGTKLRITEDGEVYNPVFRFMARYFFGHDATLKQYVNDLRNYLNQK
jgi:hypothetical protein